MTKRTKKTKTKRTKKNNPNKKAVLDESVLDIDQNDLDREFCRQPRLYIEYASELADARLAFDEADAAFKTIKATLDGLIRSDPSVYNLPDKITETVIASTIITQDEYMEAQKKVHSTQYKVNLLYAMTGALDHKRSSLENLVKLHGQNYFSTPRSDSEGRERLEKERSDKVARKCRKDRTK